MQQERLVALLVEQASEQPDVVRGTAHVQAGDHPQHADAIGPSTRETSVRETAVAQEPDSCRTGVREGGRGFGLVRPIEHQDCRRARRDQHAADREHHGRGRYEQRQADQAERGLGEPQRQAPPRAACAASAAGGA